MQKVKTYGLSLPTQLFDTIDARRGEVSRSRFILRLLEKGLDDNNEKNVSGVAASDNLKHLEHQDDNPGGGELSINE